MTTIGNILKSINIAIDVGKNLPGTNGAYKIYYDLQKQLSEYQSIDDFLNNNLEIKKQFYNLIAYVFSYPDYGGNHIKGCHILGKRVVDILQPRFMKEEKKDQNISMEEHILKWFESNKDLNFDTDRITVQAAFIAIFYV